MKTIWIWNHYATAMYYDKNGRHYYFAKYLQEAGYAPSIFCANTLHNSSNHIPVKNGLVVKKATENISFHFIKTSKYKGNGVSRVLNMLLFACNAYRVAIRLAKTDKPDVIIASSVHPFTCVAGILAAKKINVPCVAELRDIWPDAIVAVKKINKKNPIIKIMSKIEKWIYIKSDSLIFTVEGGAEYIKNKGWDKYINLNKVHYINNGVCLSEFDKNVNEKPIDDDDLSNDQIFKIVYTGSLRAANGTDLIIKIAEELIKKSDSIKILLWGGGRDKEWLEKQAHEKNLDNMVIKGSVPREYIPYILRSADVNFLHYPEYDNWKYGGSQNKLFEYLASGKPILYDFEFGYNPIKNFEAGIKSATQDPGDIVDAMIYMQKMTQDQKMKMGENARRAANNFDYRKLTDRLITLLLDLQIKFER